MKLNNEAQNDHKSYIYQTNHEKFIFHIKMKIMKIHFFLFNITSRYMYDLSKTNNMHTYPKHERVY